VGLVGYFYGRNISADRLDIANDRISSLKDQIEAYKDRLQGATPDEAAKEMRKLREGIEIANRKLQILMPDEPRQLKPSQMTALHDRSADLSKHIKFLFVYSGTSKNSALAAADFVNQFRIDDINVSGPIMIPCEPNNHGILVGLANPAHPSDDATEFIKILREAGFTVGTTTWGLFTNGPQQDFDLYVCDLETINSPGSSPPVPEQTSTPAKK
jgi:hypothetical protein